jgi:hypothetical protein
LVLDAEAAAVEAVEAAAAAASADRTGIGSIVALLIGVVVETLEAGKVLTGAVPGIEGASVVPMEAVGTAGTVGEVLVSESATVALVPTVVVPDGIEVVNELPGLDLVRERFSSKAKSIAPAADSDDPSAQAESQKNVAQIRLSIFKRPSDGETGEE